VGIKDIGQHQQHQQQQQQQQLTLLTARGNKNERAAPVVFTYKHMHLVLTLLLSILTPPSLPPSLPPHNIQNTPEGLSPPPPVSG